MKEPSSYGEQIVGATVAAIGNSESGPSAKEIWPLVETLLSPKLSEEQLASICAASLAAKCMLSLTHNVPAMKREFERQWVHYVGESVTDV